MDDSDDTFELYDLRVEVVGTDRPMVCGHRAGDSFELRGESLSLPPGQSFSIYALAALLPLLPAKQRIARFRISRIGTRTFRHRDVTAVPLG